MTARPEQCFRSRFWDDDAPVLRGAGAMRAAREGLPAPRFGDGSWDLRALQVQVNRRAAAAVLAFDRVFAGQDERHLTARELVMQRLNNPVQPIRKSARRQAAALHTVSLALYHLAQLYRFMDGIGMPRLDQLTQAHLDAFARHLTVERGLQRGYAANILGIVVWLYEARDVLSVDRLTVLPWGGRTPFQVLAVPARRENLTPRIPEQVLSPLLRWALAYVDDFADDIIAAHEAGRGLTEAWRSAGRRPRSPGGPAERFAAYVAELRRDGRALPRSPRDPGRPHLVAIMAAAGIRCWRPGDAFRVMLDQAVDEIGLDDGPPGLPLAPMPGTDMPWRPEMRRAVDVRCECRHLTAACYIVCAFLSGMRDSEVLAMRADCHETSRDAQGEVIRHYVRSREFKAKGGAGVERQWVVIEPVARAVAVMRRLGARTRAELGSDLLFVLIHNRPAGTDPALKAASNSYIQHFVEHVNGTLAPRVGLPSHPAIPVTGFGRVTTRMFRRTVAWFIANRPFGVVAGTIQYGHMSSVVFEGYAGTSESGFRTEVEAERDLARQGDIVEMFEEFKRGDEPAGPRAPELMAQFEDIRIESGDLPGKVVDAQRRERMLAHARQNLFPGVLADCFFQARTARCLSHLREEERREPVVGVCDPHCANACWMGKHLPVWEDALRDVERLAKRNRISPIQRDILNRKKAEYRRVIAEIREAGHAYPREAR